MKKVWIPVVLIAIVIVVLYPKRFGGPLCGPICPPSGLQAEKRQCLGFDARKNYIDGFTDLCLGFPYGAKRCYGTPHGSPPNTRDIELPCDYPPYTQPSLMNPGDEVAITGIVTENDNTSCARDLACYLRVQTDTEEIIVYYALPLGNPCVNIGPGNEAINLKKGEAVEIFGKAMSNSQIDVCASMDYYIRPKQATPSAVGDFVFLEKNTGWSECQSSDTCQQSIKIWSGGLVQYIGQRNEEVRLMNSAVNQIIQLINETSVLAKTCEAEFRIVDRRTTYTFHPQEKTITYPACKQELDQIDELISQLTATNYVCVPKFPIETGPELTASEAYVSECTKQQAQVACEKTDIYHALNKNFGNADGIPDCQWVRQ